MIFIQKGLITSDILERHHDFTGHYHSSVKSLIDSTGKIQNIPSSALSVEYLDQILRDVTVLSAGTEIEIQGGGNKQLPHRKSDKKAVGITAQQAISVGLTPYTPADLTSNMDVQITPEIQAQANQMGKDAAAIFAYVRNNIDYQPYFGSVKGSHGAYMEKAGNDTDQASLLIALLRASGIPAKYVAGVVELPIEKVMNWVGAENAQAAADVFSRNGIPRDIITSRSGVITHLRFFHIWAEAYIPQNTGAKSSPYSWVQMNPSFKQYKYYSGIDLATATGFNPQQVIDNLLHGATVNETESWFARLSENNITSDIETYAHNLQNWINNNKPGATVGDVLGHRTIKQIIRPQLNTLAQTFPFQTFTPQFELSALPSHWRYLANFQMFGLNFSISMPELAGKSLTLSYAPATAYDARLIEYYGGLFNVPAYLVRMKPQLKIDAQIVAEGRGVTLGSRQIIRSSFFAPLANYWDSNDKVVTTGALYAIALDHQRMPADYLKRQLDKLQEKISSRALSEEEMRLELIRITGIGYFMMVDALSDVQAKVAHVVWTKDPSQAFMHHDLTVWSFGSIPVYVELAGVGIDVKRNIVTPVSTSGKNADELAWMLNSGTLGSVAEHAIFEGLWKEPAVSTEKILQLANNSGARIYVIDSTNVNQILPQLDTFPIVKQSIREAANRGWRVIIPQRNVQFHDWYGAGWIEMDPVTGSAGYLLAGYIVTAGGSSAKVQQGDPYSKAQTVHDTGELLVDSYLDLTSPGLDILLLGVPIWITGSYAGWGMVAAVGLGLTLGGALMVGLGLAVIVTTASTIPSRP